MKPIAVKIRNSKNGKFWNSEYHTWARNGKVYSSLGYAKLATAYFLRFRDRMKTADIEYLVYYNNGYQEVIKFEDGEDNKKMSFKKSLDINNVVMKECKSSQINKIGHSDNVMVVEFHGGSKYMYIPVSEEIYNKVITAESVGKEFNRLVKSHDEITCVKCNG